MTATKHSAGQSAFAFSFASPEPVATLPIPQYAWSWADVQSDPAPGRVCEVVPIDAPAPAGKACKGCGVWKPVEAFHKLPNGPLGRHPRCKACLNPTRRKPCPPPDPMPCGADGSVVAKRCKSCAEIRPLDAYQADPRGLHGCVAHCKACVSAKWKAAYVRKRPSPPPVPLGPDGKPRSKPCLGCGETKALDAFDVTKGCKFDRAPRCKACDKAERLNPKPKALPVPAGHKRCTRCHAVKPFGEFHVAKLGRHGRQAECKTCHVAVNAEWREGRPGYSTEQTNKRRAALLSAMPPWLTPAHHAEIAAIYEACTLPLWPNHEVDHLLPLLGRGGVRGLHGPNNLAIVDVAYNRSKSNRVMSGTERAEAPEFGTKWNIWHPETWWDREWFLMGFG